MMVVSVPDPAIIGNAMGIILPVFSLGSDFNNSIPKIISRPIKKMTIDPAMANEGKSIPNNFKKLSPRNKKSAINAPAAIVALPLSRDFSLFLIVMIIGKAPMISIMAKRVKEMVVMS